jgi:hypothetical protein
MKLTLLSLRAIGVLFGLFMLWAIAWSISQIAPIAINYGQKITFVFVGLLFSTYIPLTVTFFLLLLPFTRLKSTKWWCIAYGILLVGLIYWSVGILLTESFPSSLFFSALALSQLCVIFIQRPFRCNKAEQGAAANP